MKCFYHSDMDGKCAGSIVARVTGNYNSKDYIMYNYDGEIPTELIEDGETVYFVDLSFSVNTVDKLKEIVETKHCDLIWCDHHLSSMDILAKYPEFSSIKGIRKEGISGAGMLVVCRDKHLVHGDILIDDCIGNFTLDHTKDSPVKYNFIFDKPWNRSVQEDNTKNFRVHGWDEIYELIDKLEDF